MAVLVTKDNVINPNLSYFTYTFWLARSNVDIVVGTPGRIQDLIDRGDLNLSEIKYAILDEVDQMLQVGFQEAVESILDYIPKY